MTNIVGQAFTFTSYLIFWYSSFKKEKKNMLLYDNISRLFAIISFVILKTYAGIKNTIYVVARNIVGNRVKNKKIKIKLLSFFVMLIILLSMYLFDYKDASIICIALCGIFNLYGVIMCDEQGMRLFRMIGSVFYTLFMFISGNITGGICEIICFIVILLSYIKYAKKPAK